MQIGNVNAALLFFLAAGTGAAKALFGAKTGSLSRNLVPGRLGRNRKRASSSTRERDRVRCSRVAAGCRARGSMVAIAATEGSVRLDGQPLAASGTGEASMAAQSAVLRGAFGAGQEEGRSFSARAGLHAKRDGPGEERLRLRRPRTGSRQTVTSDNVCGSRERDRPALGVAFPNSPG